MISKLKELYGPKCTAINVNGLNTEFINIPSKQMKFCEAVDKSFNIPIRLNAGNLGCPGARRSVGFDCNDEKLAKMMSENNDIPLKFINNTIQIIPAINGIKHINLGFTEYQENDLQPDIFIMYIQTFKITSLLLNLAKISVKPSIPPFLFLSVCGNIFANSYLNQVVSISFGCPESRIYGGIAENEIVVGMPFKIAGSLLNYKGKTIL